MPAGDKDKIEIRINELETDFGQAIHQIKNTLEEIRNALVGDLEGNEGLINRMRDMEATFATLEPRVAKLESQNADTEKKKWFLQLLATGACFILFEVGKFIIFGKH